MDDDDDDDDYYYYYIPEDRKLALYANIWGCAFWGSPTSPCEVRPQKNEIIPEPQNHKTTEPQNHKTNDPKFKFVTGCHAGVRQ